MARAGILDCYDITDCKIRMITTDTTSGTTYGQIVDGPGIKEMSFDVEMIGSESYGDGQILDEFSRIKACSTKVDHAWLSFLQTALMFGGQQVSSGTTPNEVLTTGFGTANLPYFEIQIACNYTGPNGSSTGAGLVILHKCKIKKYSYGQKMEDRHKVGYEVRGIPLLYQEPGWNFPRCFSFVEQETYTVLTPAAADTTAPTVSSTVPAANATSIAVSANVVITFSEAMDKVSTNLREILLYADVAGTLIASTLTWDATGTIATLDPTSNLSAATVYRLVITTNVRDLAGNPMAAPVIQKFTTA